MPSISQEVIQKLNTLQSQVWQTVSLTTSEAAGFEMTFANALTIAVPTPDIYAECNVPWLVTQFSLASMPDNAMLLMASQDTFNQLLESLKGTSAPAADDAAIHEVRPILEAIVQGICLGIGNVRNEPFVASGLSSRFQIPNLPSNFQKLPEVVRINVAVKAEDLNGTLVWLVDPETAHYLVGEDSSEESLAAFAKADVVGGALGASGSPCPDENGLEILMDIPLEVSVELGRVKMQVRDVVELGAGSIVEIDKAAGEPVDVLVNGRLVARGEVVVIDDNFGVRITEILSVQERLQKLNEAA